MSNFVTIKDKDGVTLGELPVSKEGGRLRNIIYITSTAAYEKPAWLKFVVVKGVGGGGGGGGCASTSSSQVAHAAGGSGGGYFEKRIAASQLSASETVTIGTGGTGGAAGNNAGTTGGTTSFGSHCSGIGGGGGGAGAATATTNNSGAVGGVPGTSTGGDINISGRLAPLARTYVGSRITFGNGAGSFLSGDSSQGTDAAGAHGETYGGGASGAYNGLSQTAKAGGNGAPGICIVEEYE